MKRVSDVDVTSEGTPPDVIITSSPLSSSMPHLGLHDKTDTIQPLNHIYRSSSPALTGCQGDGDDEVSMATTKRWAVRQGPHAMMTSRDSAVEHCYWARHRQASCTGSNRRFAFLLLPFNDVLLFNHFTVIQLSKNSS